jgi:nucleotide-binding universal stress UspA family protein
MAATVIAPQPAETLDELHLHRLLVPVDGSQTAELALEAAVTAARRDRGAITLLAVVPDVLAAARRWATLQVGVPNPARVQEEADTDAQRRLRDTIRRIPEDIPVNTIVRHGKPGPEIVAELDEHDYDAVMLGARGLGRVAAFIGSVSSYVLHHAAEPVFVAHAPSHSHI